MDEPNCSSRVSYVSHLVQHLVFGFYSYEKRTHDKIDDVAGKYTIVPSTFDSGLVGSFKINLECELPIGVNPIPPEGAGMYKRVVSATWTDEKRLRKPGWQVLGGKGGVKAKFVKHCCVLNKTPLRVTELAFFTSARFRLQTLTESGLYPLKVSLFTLSSSDDTAPSITAGTITDALSGATLGPINLSFLANGLFLNVLISWKFCETVL